MNTYGGGFILCFSYSITIFENSLVSRTLHNSKLPPSYWILAVTKPKNANWTLPRVAGMDKITGASWYSSYLDIFESLNIWVIFFYLPSATAIANEYMNSPFFFGWVSEEMSTILNKFFELRRFKISLFSILVRIRIILYYVAVDCFPFDISRWHLLFSLLTSENIS